jgi:predicted tellurium resistance membrane protein TerC
MDLAFYFDSILAAIGLTSKIKNTTTNNIYAFKI